MNELAVSAAFGLAAGSIMTYWMFQKGALVVEGQDPVKGLNWIKASAILNFVLITVAGLAMVLLGVNWRELARIPVDCGECYKLYAPPIKVWDDPLYGQQVDKLWDKIESAGNLTTEAPG